jgi:hypothetical protein
MPRSGYGSTFGFFMGVVSLVLLGAFVYKSVAKVMVLKPEPPAEFLDVQPGWSAKQRHAEEQLARAYWEAARRISRTSQGFGDRLPEEPPGEFSVDASAHPSVIEPAAAARRRYWRNLRKVWNNPNAWQTTYKWHTGWLTGLSY